MHYLIYVSQAAKPCNEETLRAILEKSRKNNVRDGITGLLVYKVSQSGSRGNFMQLLEGEKDRVTDAYRRVCDDPRHHTILVLQENQTQSRNFPDWSMGFRNVDEADFSGHEGYSDLGSEEFWSRAQAGELSKPLDLMVSFYRDDFPDDM